MSRFMNNLKRRVAKDIKKIVLPESDSRRILQAIDQIETEGFAKTILIGKPQRLMEVAAQYQIDLNGVEIIDPQHYPMLDTFSKYYAQRRKHKGLTAEKAKEILINDKICFGACLVAFGIADGMVGGATVPSADLIRAALQIVGMHPGTSTVSSSFIMITDKPQFGDDGIFVLGDASVVIEPTSQQLADIAVNCALRARRTVQTLDPKVALLSYSTFGSGQGEQVDRVREAAKLLRDRSVDFEFDGELQSDAALIPRIAKHKAPGSHVAGQANVLVFPNLESGNICYKILQHLYGAIALGPLLEGTAKPIMDLSRGCSAEDIVDIVAICCSDAIYQEKELKKDKEFTSHFQQLDSRVAIDDSNMSIRFDVDKCRTCNSCRKRCSEVMSMTGYYSLESTGDKPICVHCGQCSLMCRFGAMKSITQYPSIEKELENTEKTVVFEISPGVVTAIGEEFDEPYHTATAGKIIAFLKKLGGKYVFDTSIGADLVMLEEAKELQWRLKERNELLPQFTSSCPSWIEFGEIFYPELIPHISSVKNPSRALSTLIKTYLARVQGLDPERIVTVHVEPCTAVKSSIKRREWDSARLAWNKEDMKDVDYCITTRELANWIRSRQIDWMSLDTAPYDTLLGMPSGAGYLYSVSGGMLEGVLRTLYYLETGEQTDGELLHFESVRGLKGVKEASVSIGNTMFHVAAINGLANARNFIKRLEEKHSWKKYAYIEIMACPGGCIGGGGQPRTEFIDEIPVKRNRMDILYQQEAKQELHASYESAVIKKIYTDFLDSPGSDTAQRLLHITYSNKHYLLGKNDNIRPLN